MSENYNLEVINPDKFAPNVADEIAAAITDAIMDQGSCSIVVAGGKTPAGIYRLLSRPPRVDNIEWDKVHIFWSDDRFVPKDHVSSNYKLLEETLLSNIDIPKKQILAFDTSLKNNKECAKEYDTRIREHLKLGKDGLPEFDIVLLGVGEDGHTASLFPKDDALSAKNKIAAAATAPSEPSDRVTLTSDALFTAKRIYFIVKGQAKADVMKKILSDDELSTDDAPAMLFKNATGKVTWFLDAEAASQL